MSNLKKTPAAVERPDQSTLNWKTISFRLKQRYSLNYYYYYYIPDCKLQLGELDAKNPKAPAGKTAQ